MNPFSKSACWAIAFALSCVFLPNFPANARAGSGDYDLRSFVKENKIFDISDPRVFGTIEFRDNGTYLIEHVFVDDPKYDPHKIYSVSGTYCFKSDDFAVLTPDNKPNRHIEYRLVGPVGNHTRLANNITLKVLDDKTKTAAEKLKNQANDQSSGVAPPNQSSSSASYSSADSSSSLIDDCKRHPVICALVGIGIGYAAKRSLERNSSSSGSSSSSASSNSSSSGETGMVGRCVRPKSWLQKDHWVGKVVDEGGNYYRVRLLAVGKNTSYRQGEIFEVLKDEVELTGVHDGMNSVQDIWDSATKGCR